jgi:ABC-2 type transport system permease protein
MDKIITLALKDLRLLSRDYFGLFWIFAFPLLFALFFGSVMGGGGPSQTSIPIALVDEDQSDGSKAFSQKLIAKDTLKVEEVAGRTQAEELVRKGKRAAYVALLKGFGDSAGFFGQKSVTIELGYDPGHKADAGMLQGLLMEVNFANMQEQFTDPKKSRAQLKKATRDIDQAVAMKPEMKKALRDLFGNLESFFDKMEDKALKERPLKEGAGFSMGDTLTKKEITREGSGPSSAFEITFPSAIIWAIMGCVTSFSISIVTERVAGTFLRLRIAPLTWSQLLVGKGLACFLACSGVAVFLLFLGHFIFGVRLANPVGLVLAILCTSGCFVGIMMLLATLGKTEQGVAGAGWGILMPLAMLGGGMIPLIAMPSWMQTASSISPIKWGIIGLEGAIWRGFDLAEMFLPCAILLAIGAACFVLGIKNLARIENK